MFPDKQAIQIAINEIYALKREREDLAELARSKGGPCKCEQSCGCPCCSCDCNQCFRCQCPPKYNTEHDAKEPSVCTCLACFRELNERIHHLYQVIDLLEGKVKPPSGPLFSQAA